MKATHTETQMIKALKRCRFQCGSFDKKFVREINLENISPLQQWWIYKLCYKYRKQIGNDILNTIAVNWLDGKPAPLTRKEAARALKGKQPRIMPRFVEVKREQPKERNENQLKMFV